MVFLLVQKGRAAMLERVNHIILATECYDIGSNSGTKYDVAHVKWGGSWVMPSHEQQKELFENCTYTWITINGVNGGMFTGPNGGSVFLPASGIYYQGYYIYDESSGFNSTGCYWSSTNVETEEDPKMIRRSYELRIYSSGASSSGHNARLSGLTVRPVSK